MPDIPTNDSPHQIAQVGPDQSRGGVSAADYGAAVGQGLQSLGSDLGTYGLIHERQHNQTAVKAAYSQMADWETRNIYHPNTGVIHKNLGKDAAPVVDKLFADYDKTASTVSGTLKNDYQREAFNTLISEHKRSVVRTLGSYEDGQIKAYANATDDALLEQSIQAAANTYDQPFAVPEAHPVDVQLRTQRALITDAGRRNGLPQAAIDVQIAKYASATNAAVLDQMLAKSVDNPAQGEMARSWYADHKTDLLPQIRDNYEKSVDLAGLRTEAARIVPSMLLDKDGMSKPTDKALSDLDSDKYLMQHPKLHDVVRQQVLEFISDKDKALKAGQNMAMSTAYKIQQEAGYSRIPPGLIAQLSPEDDQRLQGYQTRKDNARQVNQNTSMQTRYDLERAIANPELGKAITPTDITRKVVDGTLSIPDAEKLQDDLRQAQANRDGTPSQRSAMTGMINQSVDSILAHALIDPNVKFDKDPEKFNYVADFRRFVNDEVQRRVALGQKLDQTTVDAIAAKYKAEVPEHGIGWTGGTTTTQVPLFQRIQHIEASLPTGKGDEIRENFRKTHNNQEPTPDEYFDRVMRYQALANPDASLLPVTHWERGRGMVSGPDPKIAAQRAEDLKNMPTRHFVRGRGFVAGPDEKWLKDHPDIKVGK